MKYCPNCRAQYTDDTLKFCLQDGTPLAEMKNSQMKTADYGEAETIVSNRPTNPVSTNYQTATNQNWQTPNSAAPTKSRTGMAVAVTIIVMLMLTGTAILGAWLYFKNKKTEIAKDSNSPIVSNNQNAGKVVNNSNAKTPTPSPKVNSNANSATNSAVIELPVANATVIKKEVGETIDGWKSAAEAHNLDAYMDKYADTIDYYNKKGASADTVRADKQKAFGRYDSIVITISNLVVTPDADGHHATAVFDKEWTFEGEEDTSSGKVRSELRLENSGNDWLIAGEKDLKVYYKE